MFEPLQHKRIYEEVVEMIVRRIRSGALAVGQRLPPERVLAEEMGVSRTSLREALRALESMGYIYSVTGGGNYVNSVSIGHVLSPLSAMVAQDEKLAVDIIDVRLHLEIHMAVLAARNATKQQLSQIYSTIINMQAEVEEGGTGIRGDNQFHLEIAKASQNKAFAIIVELIGELLAESRQATLDIPGQPVKSIEDHIVIFEAIRDGDEKRAGEAMLNHLQKAQANLEEKIQSDHQDPSGSL
ncbi:MAG: FadR family transcriptional regulator [Spirochaetaceae bacterium]|jgi:GntR family transcriptional repressor for pyruvate dehydrogenase complex|nr:FadR family transcriptional regulator [Spirochaetaceae bacterium]